jgi:hypothetical protein
MVRWTQSTAPMPDVVEVRMCGCKDESWDQIVLCPRHEGFLAGLMSGYNEGYYEALDMVDKVEREQITAQAGVVSDGLSIAAKVPLWAVLYAVRYGVVRQTYACGDAARLAFEFWDQFPEHIQDQIRRDVERVDPVCAPEWDWIRGKNDM